MNAQQLERHFRKIGARVKIHPPARARNELTIDIASDAGGEFFDISLSGRRSDMTQVVDVQPSMRHLLLMSHQAEGKHKFLCGHDERHWFVAAVPERRSVSTVKTAFDALKPPAVRLLEAQKRVKPRKRNRRRNEAFVRQGEWFFVPAEDANAVIQAEHILKNEPIARSGGKPHMCEELVRQGGQLVYVHARFPHGVTERQRARLIKRDSSLQRIGWHAQRRNPSVFVRGRVRHKDHKTIVLRGWHRVLMNTESESQAMRHVAFID